ncbi:MAG: hypothetical protein M1830_008420, partial [Pleopsidium flavum]
MFEGIDIKRARSNFKAKADHRRNHMGLRRYSDTANGDAIRQEQHIMRTLSGKKSSPTIRAFNSKNLLLITDEINLPSPPAHGPPYNVEPPLPPLPPLPASVRPAKDTTPRSEAGHGSSYTSTQSSTSDRTQNFDLAPPPPNRAITTIDGLSQLLFSPQHLQVILGDSSFFHNFTLFVNRYKPHTAPVLIRYLETQKAIKAVEYANAVAETIQPLPGEHSSLIPCAAAQMDVRFEARNRRAFECLVRDALPAYITHTLVTTVTETVVKKITGTTIPVMRELVGGVAEVFCLTDPAMKDNPIIYASEGMHKPYMWSVSAAKSDKAGRNVDMVPGAFLEFYRTTQYGRDYVIGRNCRFLQGPQTERQSIARLSQALQQGHEICETVLNYRRDGSPFLNLLMCAPLYDNKGAVRYFIGAQVDVSGLVEEGRGLESFEKLLSEERSRDRMQSQDSTKRSLKKLGELSQMFCLEESAVVQSHSRRNSLREDTSSMNHSIRGRRDQSTRPTRRVLGDDKDDEKDRDKWGLSSLGPSGKLPGVYQNYLLVRPFPSLRIIFVSPALRIPGLLQSNLLSHIGGPSNIRDGLCDAFFTGDAVTAKITWLSRGRPHSDKNHNQEGRKPHTNTTPYT